MRLHPGLPLVAALLLAGCGGGGSGAAGPVVLNFASVNVGAAQELLGLCQSMALNNDGPLYVNQVVMSAGKGWHHSNWFFVPDSVAAGPDGTWDCASRGFDELVGGSQGGVLFAQSTQVTGETQAFPAGAVLVIPPHSRVVGTIHLLNASSSAIDTAIQLTLVPIPASQATVHLRPMVLDYDPLDIPPLVRSQFVGHCDVQGVDGFPLDFSIYYVLAHYHYWGQGGSIGVRYPPGKVEEPVFQESTPVGVSLGQTYDPPLDLRGATSLDFSCAYDNTTTHPIYWGNGSGEMCVFLAFTDSQYRWAGGVIGNDLNTVLGPDGSGVIQNSGVCQLYRF